MAGVCRSISALVYAIMMPTSGVQCRVRGDGCLCCLDLRVCSRSGWTPPPLHLSSPTSLSCPCLLSYDACPRLGNLIVGQHSFPFFQGHGTHGCMPARRVYGQACLLSCLQPSTPPSQTQHIGRITAKRQRQGDTRRHTRELAGCRPRPPTETRTPTTDQSHGRTAAGQQQAGRRGT